MEYRYGYGGKMASFRRVQNYVAHMQAHKHMQRMHNRLYKWYIFICIISFIDRQLYYMFTRVFFHRMLAKTICFHNIGPFPLHSIIMHNFTEAQETCYAHEMHKWIHGAYIRRNIYIIEIT